MVQSPSWEANWFAASQEIHRISRNPKVRYRTHKRPPPVSILGQPNPVHIPTSHLLEIHPNIIHPSAPRSPQWSPSLRFPQQDPIHPPLITYTRYMPSPSHSRFYHPHNIRWGYDRKFFYHFILVSVWYRKLWNTLCWSNRYVLSCVEWALKIASPLMLCGLVCTGTWIAISFRLIYAMILLFYDT